jgi:ParB family chromosome partitioning protein
MAPPDPARRLGRGLDALLARKDPARAATPQTGDEPPVAPEGDAPASAGSALRMIPVTAIRPNPFQPRTEFRPEELADLEASLKANGLLQPLTVRPAPAGDGFELIAGERRLRAATRLGWTEVPAIVRETDDRAAMTLALVENLQRVDLDPIDEAEGYQRLIDEYALSQQDVADVVGKDRSTVANALRLRGLPPDVRAMVQTKTITAGHARALLALGNPKAMLDLAHEVTAHGLSVRDVERRVQAGRAEPAKSGRKKAGATRAAAPAPAGSAESRRIEELLRRKLQTGVNLHLSGKDRGELRIAFFSNDDLERLLGVLGISLDAL